MASTDHSTGKFSSDTHISSIDFQYDSDDAWYTVGLSLHNQTLTVRYVGFSENEDDKFNAGDFNSLKEVEEFEEKFRRSAVQAQDSECSMLVKGMTVCASYVHSEDELKFYNAVIELVTSNDHTFNEGEEVCTCSFAVSWVHGPMNGCKTTTGIGHILILQPGSALIDPTLASFLRMSREKFEFSSYRPKKRKKFELTSHNSEDDFALEGGGVINMKKNEEDINLGDKSIATQKPREKVNCYFILIENLEKDLAPQVVVNFIYTYVSITSQAYVFPSLFFETYARGVIVVDSQQKLQKLYNFLHNPAHLIMSSRGRPWMTTEDKLKDATFGDIIFRSEPLKNVELCSTITVVTEGTKEFEKGKRLKELFLEFAKHQQCLHKRLALEGKKVLPFVQFS